jgi:hypothetical protein
MPPAFCFPLSNIKICKSYPIAVAIQGKSVQRAPPRPSARKRVGKGGLAMKKLTTAKPNHSNHSQDLERVGTLTKDGSVITIWRKVKGSVFFRFEDVQYYVEENGVIRHFDAFEETECWLCPTPAILEEWIEEKMEEGYKLELEIEKVDYTDLKKEIAGRTLEEWYSRFLRYYKTPDGTLMLWVWFDRWEKAKNALEISRDDFNDYWALLRWEREMLTSLFMEALYDIWVYSNEVVYYAAKVLGKYKTCRAGNFSLADTVRFIERASRRAETSTIDIVRRIIEIKEDKEWKEWLVRHVLRTIYDAYYQTKDKDDHEEEE